jgi:hypothetical protein
MIALRQHLKAGARNPPIALNRLIRIGVGAKGNGGRDIALVRKLSAEQRRRVRFGKQLALKIKPRREIMKRMAR